ncbi:ATP-binding protein [Azospirillum halopraeferens]|uniref:ATP-binding protein n=1 Tax=Azospirillum halopraeferens TaxID=34010 RepID=UPI000400F0EE|nr:ATP-binding protein [Azospirillum halopraeferens]
MPASTGKFLFHRPELARRIVDRLTGDSPFGAEPTLCLTAPRRTGKSTFLRHDLTPELDNRHIGVVYVDLWSDRNADPGHLVAEAIRQALRRADGLPVRVARSAGLSKVGVGATAIDIDRIGQPQGATLTDALGALMDRTGKRVALVVDEAQHAIVTDAGLNAMFALKAARDTLNTRDDGADGPNLVLVLTGSHRDKLGRLVLGRDQPFYGASVQDFPLLGRDYTDAYTAWLNGRLAADNRFDPAAVYAAFDAVGRRPEILAQILKDIALDEGAGELRTALSAGAQTLRGRLWQDYESAWSSLTRLQQAVIERLVAEEAKFTPFSAASLAAYSAAVGDAVEVPSVQAAIEALRRDNLVWRSARGQYALEDQGMAEWLKARRPPEGPEPAQTVREPGSAAPTARGTPA